MNELTTAAGRTPPRFARGGRHCLLQPNLGEQPIRRSLTHGTADAGNHKLRGHALQKCPQFAGSRVHRVFKHLGTVRIHAKGNRTQAADTLLIRRREVRPELGKFNRVHGKVLMGAEHLSSHLVYRFGTLFSTDSVLNQN
jgi:hypothetical protein